MKFHFFFQDFGPSAGPGRVPLDWRCGEVDFADVFTPVASVAVSFASEGIFGNPVDVFSSLSEQRQDMDWTSLKSVQGFVVLVNIFLYASLMFLPVSRSRG